MWCRRDTSFQMLKMSLCFEVRLEYIEKENIAKFDGMYSVHRLGDKKHL